MAKNAWDGYWKKYIYICIYNENIEWAMSHCFPLNNIYQLFDSVQLTWDPSHSMARFFSMLLFYIWNYTHALLFYLNSYTVTFQMMQLPTFLSLSLTLSLTHSLCHILISFIFRWEKCDLLMSSKITKKCFKKNVNWISK